MPNVSPAVPRPRSWTWAPWLAILAGGIAVHAWIASHQPVPETRVEVVAVPGPPVVVSVEPDDLRPTTDTAVAEEVSDEDRDRHRRRNRRRRRHSSFAIPSTIPADMVSCRLQAHWVCTVDRAGLLGLMHASEPTGHRARIVPHRRDGRTDGLKLFAIREGSLLHRLQFRNGDLLTQVDGVDATDFPGFVERVSEIEQALEVGPVDITVHVQRKGVTLAQDISFR